MKSAGPSLHSSIRVNPDLPLYLWGSCKFYYLPLYADTRFAPLTRRVLGCDLARDRSPLEMRASFLKAKGGEFSHVKIPLDRIGGALVAEAFSLARELQLPLVLQISSAHLGDEAFFRHLRSLAGCELEILLEPSDFDPAAQIAALRESLPAHLSLLAHREISWPGVLTPGILRLNREFHLYFPFALAPASDFLACAESQRVLRRLRQTLPEIKFLPPKGTDLCDPRVQPHFELEPWIEPCFATASRNPRVRFSVVIPTYNNQNHLRVTLRHLCEQDVGPDAFEIVLVDDGSTDQTQTLVIEQILRQERSFNFKYIFFPRERRRSMGDAQFRAGIARNLGAKHAVGEILCFLDSDIVTPPHYLRTVGEELPRWGALQARRKNLTKAASHLACEYGRVEAKRDVEPDDGYWEAFTRGTRDWHLLPYNWKYVCTHSFSLQRDLFWRIGGFKRNFIFYGFEDTDLGYRLTKGGHHLHLLNLEVFHLYHEMARSEFMNLSSFRQVLLSRTAQIFYLHHLDDDVFENLRGFMGAEFNFARMLHWLKRLATLSFLWKPRALAWSSLRALRVEVPR